MAQARTKGALAQALLAFAACAALATPVAAEAQGRHRGPRPSVEGDVRPPPRFPRPDDEDGRPPAHRTRPLPEIVAHVQATPPYNAMDYIGVAGFEMRRMVYVLRFLDGRQVVVVHVDARSGRVLRRLP